MNNTFSLKWIAGAVLLAYTVGFASAASAMTIRELRTLAKSDRKQGENFVRYYQVGLMEGALEAQSQAARSGAKPLFCPGERRLEPAMAEGLFNTELQRNADVYEADMPAQLVMTNALSNVYPCNQ